jgi:uncharacterized membrane protein YebE (DUF533 family)
MHDQDMAIVRALVPVAWADGVFAEKEKETLEALLDAYNATENERKDIREYAAQKRSIDDINLQDLSADDRRVLLQHAVLLCYVDNDYSDDEKRFVDELAKRLKVPSDEAKQITTAAADRAQRLLKLL